MKKGFSYYRKVWQWKRIRKLPEHDVAIETANGLLSCSNKDWLIGKHLFVQRNYEIEFIESSVKFLQKEGYLKNGTCHTAVDIGANIGMICIALLRKGFFKNALAFEPTPNNFRLLKKNVAQNDLEGKIRCFNYALSSVSRLAELEILDNNSGDNRVRVIDENGRLNERKRQTLPVEAKTFDQVLSENSAINPGEIDLLWLDIQGHEGHFFRGARDFFSRRKIPCVSEFWGYGIRRSGMSADEYCRSIESIFEKFYHYTPENGFRALEISELRGFFETEEDPRRIESVIFV